MLQEKQALVEVGCVEDSKNSIGGLRPLHASENNVNRDMFFERMRAERMRSRKIDKLRCRIVGLQETDMALYRYARVVTNALLESGKTIKKGALAGIGITDYHNARIRAFGYGYLIGRDADF